MAIASSRAVKWSLLAVLVMTTFFLASFNATLRYIVDQRVELGLGLGAASGTVTPLSASATVTPLPASSDRDSRRADRDPDSANPGGRRTTLRPLDGLGGDGPAAPPLVRRPGDDPSAARTAADAHYAKALRMLSSPFDRIGDGGNALPRQVHAGDYDQEIHKRGGRGEGFVKPNQLRGRRRRRNKGNNGNNGNNGNKGRGTHPLKTTNNDKWQDEPTLKVVLDVVYEWFLDTTDWIEDTTDRLYQTLGAEVEYHDNSAGDANAQDGYETTYEDESFSWGDTRMGRQLISVHDKVVALWSTWRTGSRSPSSRSPGSRSPNQSRQGSGQPEAPAEASLSKQDLAAREGLFHLERAAELGHSEAQRVVANSLASGILPLSDHSLLARVALADGPTPSLLLPSTPPVPDDFSAGGERLSRAVLLWHLSAMDGDVESAMALGYRHLHSAAGGLGRQPLVDGAVSPGYDPARGGRAIPAGEAPAGGHYGVSGTCPTALAYYEAAAHAVMDELENGPTKGKVNPPVEEHRLAEIYAHGGASSALDPHNKPDELEEALQYYRMLASRARSPEPDLVAAFTVANFYYHGYRGVRQDPRLALEHYETCGDHDHWEGGGQAGLMHVWGIGMEPEERDLGRAYAYFAKGTPGGIDGCAERMRRRKRLNQRKDGGDAGEEVTMCDRHCVNGMGLLHLLGVEGLVDRNVNAARRWFEHGKDFGDPDSIYNYAMLRLGWMVTELEDLPTKLPEDSAGRKPDRRLKTAFEQNYMAYRADSPAAGSEADVLAKAKAKAGAAAHDGPSASDHNVAIQELARAASKGHLQAKHRLGMLHAAGFVPGRHGRPSAADQSCAGALRHFKSVADAGHAVSRRNRAAWRQHGAGDHESALRNYLAAAETGNEVGQVNAAFLLERGYCLGMTAGACTRASIRLWRAAARQGNLEACLRVGDFYYYGRMKTNYPGSGGSRQGSSAPPASKEGSAGDGETRTLYGREEYLASLEAKAFYFIPGPYQWTRYILYPEELFDLTRNWLSRSAQSLWHYVSVKSSDASNIGETEEETSSQDACDGAEGTCNPEWARYPEDIDAIDASEGEDEHMAIAAQYYRKAAEEHKSARANFNLGFMHEWGLGLTQDFPLAKRHYDLAGEDANMAAAIALRAMDLHQKVVKFGMILKEYGEG